MHEDCGGGRQGLLTDPIPKIPKMITMYKMHFKVSHLCNVCEMDKVDYNRSFDEGDRRSVLVYSLGIECVNLKSAPPTTQRKVVVWVKTIRDLQALKKLRIGPESPPPPFLLLRRCQFLPLLPFPDTCTNPCYI